MIVMATVSRRVTSQARRIRVRPALPVRNSAAGETDFNRDSLPGLAVTRPLIRDSDCRSAGPRR